MRILELCTSPDSGGLELYMVRASAAMAAAGEKVLAVIGPNSRIESPLRQCPIETDRVTCRFYPLPLGAARRLAKLIEARRIDVVHVHWARDLPLAALAKQLSARSPRLVHTRHMQITRSKKDMYHHWIYRQVDILLTITEAMATKVRQCLPEDISARVHTLYHGASQLVRPAGEAQRNQLRGTWRVPEEAVLVGVFSRLEEPKGQHLVVEALRRAREEGLPLYALVVGRAMDSDYVDELKDTIRRLNLDDRIHFEGFTEDVQQWMQACDVVALTTREETFGLVLIEAMHAGVAVVGSDRGGVPEIIQHESNGLLFRSCDADDLYAQLRRLTVNPTLRDRLASRGKQVANQRFNEENHFRKLREYLYGRTGQPGQAHAAAASRGCTDD